MNISEYQCRLRELLRYIHGCDWVDLLDIDSQGIQLSLHLPELTKQPIDILFSVHVRNGLVYIEPILLRPNIRHPNICQVDHSICIVLPDDPDDAPWNQSLVLLLWGVAELLQQPNFDDAIINSTAQQISNIVEYIKQFKMQSD